MKRFPSPLLPICSVAFCRFVWTALSLYAVTASAQEISGKVAVDGDRPLYMAAQQIAEQTRTLITFEELVFEHPDDFMEWRRQNGETRSIPKFGKFDFDYEPGTAVDAVLSAMIDKYNAEYPGNYQLVGGDSAFHIIPESSKDASGNFIPRKSLLDTEIMLDVAQNNAHELVCEIARQVSVANAVELSCLTDLARLSSVILEDFSATSGVARDVLVEILKQAGGGRSWVILRGSSSDTYAISFIGQQNR